MRDGVMVTRQGDFLRDLGQAQVIFFERVDLRGLTPAEIQVCPGEKPGTQPVKGLVVVEDPRIQSGRLRLGPAQETG